MARGINQHVDGALGQNVLCGGLHIGGHRHIQRLPLHARILRGPVLNALWLARRNDHHCACLSHLLCTSQTNTRGGAHQPDAAAGPVDDGRIERLHFDNTKGVRRVKDKVTSPKRMPHLLMVALLSITRSSIRYIQSSKSTCQTRPSTGKSRV